MLLCSRKERSVGKKLCGCVGQSCLLHEYNFISWQIFLFSRWSDWLCSWLVRCRMTVVIDVNCRWLPLREFLQPVMGQGSLLVMVRSGCSLRWQGHSNGGLLCIL